MDLPVVVSNLPAVAVALPALSAGLPSVPAGLPSVSAGLPSVSAGLPAPAPGLPSARRANPFSDLPVPATVGLPITAASLPDLAAALPTVGGTGLPVVAEVLPVVASGMSFGEIELPTINDSFPPSSPKQAGQASSRRLPAGEDPAFGLFGDMDLPREAAPGMSFGGTKSTAPPVDPAADFGDLQLDEKARSMRPPPAPYRSSNPPRAESSREDGGMSFGEVELGGGSGGDDGPIGTESTIGTEAALGADPSIGREAALDSGETLGRAARESLMDVVSPAKAAASLRGATPREAAAADEPRKRPVWKAIVLALFVLAVLGGAALQLTTYGAFGYLAIGDLVRAGEYDRATAAALAAARKTMAADTYDAAKTAVDAAYAAHLATPRATPLTAYAALVDYETSVRFGADTTRASRAKGLLASLPPGKPVKYTDVAAGAQFADAGDYEKATRALDQAARDAGNAPLKGEIALLRGSMALAAKNGTAALAEYKRALEAADDARAHYGLARAFDLLGDAANARRELAATLATSPQHPGALTLRARTKSAAVAPALAVADLTLVLEGPARAKASPNELSDAYATRAWVSLDKGAASDARDAFAQAVTLNQRNGEALNGQGRLFLNEGRYTEALARFDTALQLDQNSPETIANDAEAKLALERLADAKQQLAAARERFPKSIPVLILLGKVEQHLGNSDAAEADLRAATAYVDPARPDGVLPYVALSELLSERGHLAEARTTLEDAKKMLPVSSALDRAFGEVSELQGDYDGAIAHYRAALVRDPKDVAAHFRLGVALLRQRKFDDASQELDRVAAVDKEYPGLSLERGVLFEESGDVERAIEQFNGALAKAPEDPDLELRVGSAYVSIGRPDEALPMLHKVLEKRPQSAEAHHFIGRALMLQGGTSAVDALRYLKRAVELDPNRAEFHVYLAWAANDANPAQLEVARDEVDKALALDKVNPEAYWQRGVLERVTAAVDDAIKDEKRALELRPSRYEAHATLAECYTDKNNDTDALAEWAKAVAADGATPNADGSVRHPFWHWRYGRLLKERAGSDAGLPQFLLALPAAEKLSPRPAWLADLEFAAAEALRKQGHRAEAIEHYKRFVEIATVNSPDLADAKDALLQLTGQR
jgi:tetratricopeptide (TPR) repeat protein